VFFYATTFWVGLLFVGGLSLATSRLPDDLQIPARRSSPPWDGCSRWWSSRIWR
jgi:hypothetical protein